MQIKLPLPFGIQVCVEASRITLSGLPIPDNENHEEIMRKNRINFKHVLNGFRYNVNHHFTMAIG